jgi:hypothetical protein
MRNRHQAVAHNKRRVKVRSVGFGTHVVPGDRRPELSRLGAAGTSPLDNEHRSGTYHCAACDLPLYSSETKFESGTG